MNIEKLISLDLKEDSESIEVIYQKDKMKVLLVPNYSEKSLRYFWIIKQNKFCRISMMEPVYMNFPDENLILTKEEINELIKTLNTTYTGELNWNKGNVYKRNWDFLISQLNETQEFYENLKWIKIPKDLPIPDYTLLPTID